jgi:hypothetical protein
MMTNQLSQIRWWRLTWTALTVYSASFLLVFLIVTAYASYLGFQARGAPDPSMIMEFANQYAPWFGPISLILFTLLGTRWLASFVRTDTQLHGLVLGVLVALVNLIFEGIGAFNLSSLLITLLIVGAGWLGGRLSAQQS